MRVPSSWSVEITSNKQKKNGTANGEAAILKTDKILKLRSDGTGELLSGKGALEGIVDAALPSKFKW